MILSSSQIDPSIENLLYIEFVNYYLPPKAKGIRFWGQRYLLAWLSVG